MPRLLCAVRSSPQNRASYPALTHAERLLEYPEAPWRPLLTVSRAINILLTLEVMQARIQQQLGWHFADKEEALTEILNVFVSDPYSPNGIVWWRRPNQGSRDGRPIRWRHQGLHFSGLKRN